MTVVRKLLQQMSCYGRFCNKAHVAETFVAKVVLQNFFELFDIDDVAEKAFATRRMLQNFFATEVVLRNFLSLSSPLYGVTEESFAT